MGNLWIAVGTRVTAMPIAFVGVSCVGRLSLEGNCSRVFCDAVEVDGS